MHLIQHTVPTFFLHTEGSYLVLTRNRRMVWSEHHPLLKYNFAQYCY